MDRIKVLITGPNLKGGPGGIRTHILHILNAFSTSDIVEIRHLPVTPGLHDDERWATRILRFSRSLLSFARAVRAADTLHLNSTFDSRSLIRDCVHLAIATIVFRKPAIIQFHGGLPAKTAILKHLRWLFALILRQAKDILILSKLQAAQFYTLFPGMKYRLVPNYIDCDISHRPTRLTNPHRLRFLFMGRVHVSKGIEEIVEAAEILAQRGYSFDVELCGDGPARGWLEREVSRRTLTGNRPYLIYSGSVDGAEKISALRRSDVILLPSYQEGFPYTMLEGAKFGLPMIATAVGGIPDFIRHRYNGMLIRESNAELLAGEMEYAIRHPRLIHEMGRRAQLQVEAEFSFDCLRKTFGQIYRSVSVVG